MDHDPHTALKRSEHFAHHVSEVMEAVATLLDGPDPETLDFTRVPSMWRGCSQCTIEGLLYLSIGTFRAAQWDGARVRRQIPAMVAQALTSEIG